MKKEEILKEWRDTQFRGQVAPLAVINGELTLLAMFTPEDELPLSRMVIRANRQEHCLKHFYPSGDLHHGDVVKAIPIRTIKEIRFLTKEEAATAIGEIVLSQIEKAGIASLRATVFHEACRDRADCRTALRDGVFPLKK